MSGKVIDISNQKFGRLTATKRIAGSRPVKWECVCECGQTTSFYSQALREGRVKSCGCYRNEKARARMTVHGKHDTDEYRIYRGIINRCENPSVSAYPSYGGRGISMCERWRRGDGTRTGFECFFADMGARPSKKHSVDRTDNDGNYEPGNCRWVVQLDQTNNRRNTRYVVYRSQKMALAEAVRLAGGVIHREAAWVRIDQCGWSVEEAVETPRTMESPNSNARHRQSGSQGIASDP